MYDAPSEPSDNDKHIPQVAQFGIYLLAWEHSIRKQAARTLGSLAHFAHYITIGRLSINRVGYTANEVSCYGEHGPVMGCNFTILVASTVFGAEVVGSSPILLAR